MNTELFKEDRKIAAFRLPITLADQARKKCQTEDITFSQLMRRAIRREVEVPAAGPKPLPK